MYIHECYRRRAPHRITNEGSAVNIRQLMQTIPAATHYSRRVPQPPQNSPLPESAAPQLVQKAFPDEFVRGGAAVVLDLFPLNFPIVLTTRITKIAKRISPVMLNEGIIYSPGDEAASMRLSLNSSRRIVRKSFRIRRLLRTWVDN